ncbi:phosphopantetheine-binding protein [Xenorhabdus khoisanae]|uniref:phosphopantetheine-binding protein n=1 Tax=Xenorhabdus khoisanae TaxID=880157 RepID=UPI0023583B39|nr:phosphopantetheine-binding protein [Xenorhabdus khoisanae]MDC9615907.1 phosphopantetheine-binding protein [Xenorhabdus khoisanae]
MTSQEIKDIIYEFIDRKVCRDEDDIFKLGVITSFQLVRLYGCLEKKTGCKLSIDKIMQVSPRTINQIATMFLNDEK